MNDAMNLANGVDALKLLVKAWRAEGLRIGVVPTMGALHAGHLSLVRAARTAVDRLITTLFVNPTQFGPTEDLSKYPRTLADDLQLLQPECVDAVFVPSEQEIYPPGFSTFVEPPEVARGLEGVQRPTHFRGVTTVVLKLLNMTRADIAFFGQKDFQQIAVIRRMVRDLDVPCQIVMCPTVRDPDGLALSSRNRFLDASQREIGLSLWQSLKLGEGMIRNGTKNASAIVAAMRENMHRAGISQIDYAVICDPDSLQPQLNVQTPAVILVAAKVGSIRLLDNLLIE